MVVLLGPNICGELTPVTINIVLIVFSRSSLILAPHIIFASSSSLDDTVSTTFLASSRVISGPPATLIKAPVAPEISTSNKGLFIAFSTDSTALFVVSLSPTPITATPPFDITVFISAKSKLTKPAFVTNSAIPFTALVNISSAILKAVCKGKSGANSNNLSFGITIRVSTMFSIFSKPIIAFSYLL